jgi:hypothetical protein
LAHPREMPEMNLFNDLGWLTAPKTTRVKP